MVRTTANPGHAFTQAPPPNQQEAEPEPRARRGNGQELREAPPLPERIADWVRAIKNERTINDLVEDTHRVLVNESPVYRAYLRAVYDEHAITGSLSFDNCKACELIQARAKELGYDDVAEEKLGVINMALGVVLRRYKVTRKQRRNTLKGQMVPNGDEDE